MKSSEGEGKRVNPPATLSHYFPRQSTNLCDRIRLMAAELSRGLVYNSLWLLQMGAFDKSYAYATAGTEGGTNTWRRTSSRLRRLAVTTRVSPIKCI